MDGTFENTSLRPKIHQIYTIHIKCRDTYVGTVIVFMENRTTEMYKEVFNWLKIRAKSIGTNNKFIIISDFEKATIKALRECFPLAKVHGCYFHYCQAVIKRWTKLRLDIPDQILSMVLTIPSLPADKFPEVEEILKDEIKIKNLSDRDPNILLFMDYLHKTWINAANHVSVHDCPNLNNDACESFNRHNKKKLGGKHPCIWELVDGVDKVLKDEEINYSRLLTNAKKPKRNTPKHVIDRRYYINNLRHEIEQEKSRFNIKNFMKMIPRSLLELQHTLKQIIGNNADDIDYDSSVPAELDIFETDQNENINNINLLNEVEQLIPSKSCNPFLNRRLQILKTEKLPKKSNCTLTTSTLLSTVTSGSLNVPDEHLNNSTTTSTVTTETPSSTKINPRIDTPLTASFSVTPVTSVTEQSLPL
ncbi:uncharacterized protein LOC130673555 [Microplitis mediator]|uniref:uncharacterized protein LOC130673555 n=1 Tax=Microplitis mediator TaxID=375433 RepID=UPI002554F02F|nr:uncharacterized protein LOC130673555 [Microplitis mediator]